MAEQGVAPSSGGDDAGIVDEVWRKLKASLSRDEMQILLAERKRLLPIICAEMLKTEKEVIMKEATHSSISARIIEDTVRRLQKTLQEH